MTQQGPQSTHNKSDVHRPSAYERMNSEIENFINQVAEEEKRNNTVLHAKAGTQENQKPSLFQQLAAMMTTSR